MIAIWYDPVCDALWVSFRPEPVMPRTLMAEASGDTITIRRCVGQSIIVAQTFDMFTRQDGSTFPDAASALAYLQGEFAKRPQADRLISAYTAQHCLGGHRVVAMTPSGFLAYASSDDPDSAAATIGITLGAADSGQGVAVVTAGPVNEPSWSFALGSVYLGTHGGLTQTAPVAGYVLRIGRALGATRLLVDLDEPFFLAA